MAVQQTILDHKTATPTEIFEIMHRKLTGRLSLKRVVLSVLLGLVLLLLVRSPLSTLFQSNPSKVPGVIKYLQDLEELNFTESYIDRSEADSLFRKIRIICLILTTEKNFDIKAKTVEKTWANRCNKYYFVLNTKRTDSHILQSKVKEKRSNLLTKVKFGFRYVYENMLDEFDWIFKADDDTYAVLENMRFLLSHYNSSKPGYLGYHFNRFIYNGYMSGGAGYVISNAGFRSLVEKGINKGVCEPSGEKWLRDLDEDMNIGYCLNKTRVPVLSSMDIFGRETFHPAQLQSYLNDDIPTYLYEWSMTKAQTGPGCCSRFTVTFHYMSPEAMILVDHLLYRTSVYGQSVSRDSKDVFRIEHVRHKHHYP